MVAPILPDYAESFNVNYTLVGFVISSFALTRVFVDIPAGLLSSRYNKKSILMTGLILIALSSIMAGFAQEYWVLVVARMMEGAGSALYVTTATVFLAQIAGEEKRGQWMSLYMGMILLGSIFGPTFGGVLANLFDITAPFFAYAGEAVVALVPTLLLPTVPHSKNGEAMMGVRSIFREIWVVLRHPSFLLATFATFTLFFIRTGVRSTLVPLFAGNNLGFDTSTIGLILTIAGIATAFTIVPMGGISDRIGRRTPLFLCLLLTAVITAFIPMATEIVSLTFYMIIYGAVIGLSGPMAAYVTDVSPQDNLEISMGLYRTIGDLGFVAGPLLLGYLADLTATPVVGETHSGLIGVFPFAVASLFLLASAFSLLRADDPVKRRHSNEAMNS